MRKYLWIILIFAFVGMKAESGWEDFGTYKKQMISENYSHNALELTDIRNLVANQDYCTCK